MNAKLFVKPKGLVNRMPELALLLPAQRILFVKKEGSIFLQSNRIGSGPEDSYCELVNASGTFFQLDAVTAQNIIDAHNLLLGIDQDLDMQIIERCK